MRVVIQRVKSASVVVNAELISKIGHGFLLLVGVEDDDTNDDIDWLVQKIAKIRIFDDLNGVMNLSIDEVGGDILAVSQFTLLASTKKGNRPSYIRAAKGDFSKPMYEAFCNRLTQETGKEVKQGIFGADMKVELINDGPVTILFDTKNKE
ncbi:MAG: D-aminoacyl-tRNA deacylase [Bacteroidales bacterium]|nr:D-aminoacyl-tRNA deacylase [Bacteroidales bacterium]